jgi:hypothetical protein
MYMCASVRKVHRESAPPVMWTVQCVYVHTASICVCLQMSGNCTHKTMCFEIGGGGSWWWWRALSEGAPGCSECGVVSYDSQYRLETSQSPYTHTTGPEQP